MKPVKLSFRGAGTSCNVCERSVNELKSFSKDDILILDLPYPVYLYDMSRDGKLGLTYRAEVFNWIDKETGCIEEQRVVGRSWECFDCLTSDPEKIQSIMQEKDVICIKMNKLRPMNELKDFFKDE